MSIQPIITFKAGICDLDETADPPRVKPRATPGYIYLHSEDDLMHFCWRPRAVALDQPELDLLMLPTDGSFKPHRPTHAGSTNSLTNPTNGRIYILNFSSSSQQYLFWLQSRSQHPSYNPAWFSARDLKLGEIVDSLLQGDEIDVQQAIANLPTDYHGNEDDDDETMEDVEGIDNRRDHDRSGSGGGRGAGADATGGDIREEGEGAREGGADGGRADSLDANTIIQNFIKSMPGSRGGNGTTQPQEQLFTTLTDLLTPNVTISFIESAPEDKINQLLQYLPASLTAMAQAADDDDDIDLDHASTEAAESALSLIQKKDILRRVLHSPQFSQSMSSLTIAIRDGGLPILSESLEIPVKNGGYMRRGGVPLGGGEAVEAFLQGVKEVVEKEQTSSSDSMDTR